MKKILARVLLAASLLFLAPVGAAFADVAIPDAGTPEVDAGTPPVETDAGTPPVATDGGTKGSTISTGCSVAHGFGAGGLLLASVAAAFATRRRKRS